MTEWISLAISILGLLLTLFLEKEKLTRSITDFYSWQTQRKQKRAGEEFIKKIRQTTERGIGSMSVVFVILFFLLTIGSGLVSLLQAKTIEEVGAVGTISLSIILWLSLRGLIREAAKQKFEWYVTLYTIIMFQMSIGGLGLIWAFATLLYISVNVPVFWAGMAGAITSLAIVWLIFFVGKHNRGTQ